jgi:hypothetical protein
MGGRHSEFSKPQMSWIKLSFELKICTGNVCIKHTIKQLFPSANIWLQKIINKSWTSFLFQFLFWEIWSKFLLALDAKTFCYTWELTAWGHVWGEWSECWKSSSNVLTVYGNVEAWQLKPTCTMDSIHCGAIPLTRENWKMDTLQGEDIRGICYRIYVCIRWFWGGSVKQGLFCKPFLFWQ